MDAPLALLLQLLLAHPGHGAPATPWCVPPTPDEVVCPLPAGDLRGGGQAQVARRLLQRGGARRAASLVAREAERSPEAAEVLADALQALGDDVGAARVRARFTAAGAPRRPDPAATGATTPPASPGTR